MQQNGHVELKIASGSGDLTDEFPQNQKAGPLKVSVMERLGLEPSAADEFRLILDDEALDESKTLKELGLEDGTCLILEPFDPEVI